MLTAWAYAVVSSSKQEDTIDDQLTWARGVAREQGWKITREFHGVSSGRDGTRKLLEQLLGELRATPKAARPDRVLMVRIDRLGRGDGLDALAAVAEVRKLGVTLHTRDRGDVSIRSATDTLVPYIDAITAARENEVRSEKSRAMHARKRAAGEVQGLPPYGFVVIDKRLHPYEPEAAFLRDLYERRARGWSYGKLSSYARTHAPSKRRKDGSVQALRWSTTTLTIMFSNPVYCGAIIDAELWDEVFALRKNAKPVANRNAVNPWPLRGALRCVCGLAVSGRVSGAGKYRQRYYVCTDSAAHDGYPGHRATKIETQFVTLLKRLVADPALIANYTGVDRDDRPLRSRKATLERERDTLGQKRERIWSLAEDGRVPADEVATRLEELRVRNEKLAAMIADVEHDLAQAQAAARMWNGAAEAIRHVASAWKEADVSLQQELATAVGALVGGFWVDPTQQHILLVGAHGEARRKAETSLTDSPFVALRTLAALGK